MYQNLPNHLKALNYFNYLQILAMPVQSTTTLAVVHLDTQVKARRSPENSSLINYIWFLFHPYNEHYHNIPHIFLY